MFISSVRGFDLKRLSNVRGLSNVKRSMGLQNKVCMHTTIQTYVLISIILVWCCRDAGGVVMAVFILEKNAQ